jgi:hypothetical protein
VNKFRPLRDANRNRLRAFYYQDEAVAFPPNYPIPGKIENDDGQPISQHVSHSLPFYMGKSFTTVCEFWAIVQEVANAYLSQGGKNIMDRVPLAFAESKYQKLLHWMDTLVPDMAREVQSIPHITFFQ